MNIQTTKIELVKMILNIENPEIITKVFKLLKKESPDFWAELSETEKEEINLGIEQLDRDEKVSFSSFLKKVS